MSALPSILCCLVIFQIVPQLLCDDTTIIPTDSSNKSTDLLSSTTMDVKASPTNIPLLTSPGAAASPSLLPSSSTMHPPDATIKPTRAPAIAAAAPRGGASGSSPSTQPPLIHQPAAESSPPANQTTKFSMPAENNSTKTDKNSANSIYNHGYLTSFVVLLLVGAIF